MVSDTCIKARTTYGVQATKLFLTFSATGGGAGVLMQWRLRRGSPSCPCFIVRDANKQALAFVYCEDEPGHLARLDALL